MLAIGTIPASVPAVASRSKRAAPRAASPLQDERGVSRDEMASALMDVAEGRIPKDRIALKCLRDEVAGWPFLQVRLGRNGTGRRE